MSEQVNLGELLSACIDAAQQAGQIITNVWKSGKLDIKDKGGDDPFTKADVESQQLIIGLIQNKWPTLAFMGEEDCEIPPVSHSPRLDFVPQEKVPEEYRAVAIEDLCVFVDPLDATKEYTLGHLEACMSLVGIGYKGEAVGGVIFQPFVEDGKGKTVWALRGLGMEGAQVVQRDGSKLIVTTTRSHGSPETEAAIAKLKPDEVLRAGGAAYKALLVIEGKADAYVFATPGTKKWDSCAPEAIVRAIGGQVTDMEGNRLPYFKDSEPHNKKGLLVSLQNHSKYVEILNK